MIQLNRRNGISYPKAMIDYGAIGVAPKYQFDIHGDSGGCALLPVTDYLLK